MWVDEKKNAGREGIEGRMQRLGKGRGKIKDEREVRGWKTVVGRRMGGGRWMMCSGKDERGIKGV